MAAPPASALGPRAGPQLTVSERLLETTWGVLILLSVTGSAQLGAGATSGQILVIGFATATAWGLVEGVLQVVQGRVERRYSARIITRAAESAERAEPDLTNALQNSLVQHLAPDDQARIRAAIVEAAGRATALDTRIRRRDFRGGAETFLALWGATIPSLLPFVFFPEARVALAYSQAIGVGTLFAVGAAWGRYTDQHPLRAGGLMAGLGLGLAALLQALGA